MVVIAAVIVIGAVSFFALVPPTNDATHSSTTSTSSTLSCPETTPARDEQISGTTFGAVTEFTLPYADSGPNMITVQPDGSVWFAENGLPGVGHLFPNGTLNEYKLPFTTYPQAGQCYELTYSWGVAFWDGSAWVANENEPLIEGVNPTTGAITNVTIKSDTSPYTLTAGPDGGLWFTLISGGPEIGRISPGTDAVQYYTFPGNDSWSSEYITFANSTLGYVLAFDPLSEDLHAITSIVYSFNPQEPNSTFQQVGGNEFLYEPSGMTIGEGGLWLTEHDGSAMAFFNMTSSTWAIVPTSTVSYTPDTLTYFDASNGSAVWFNEHYGNKIGMISDDGTHLTEYSLADPPIENFSEILSNINTLTVAQGDGRTWFTQWTGDVVGFVNQSYAPPFSVSANEYGLQIRPGTTAQVQLQLSGQDSRNLSVQFSDNEFNNGTTHAITFTPNVSSFASLSGTESITVTISPASNIKSGDYVAALTVSDGLVLQSVYVTIDVTTSTNA